VYEIAVVSQTYAVHNFLAVQKLGPQKYLNGAHSSRLQAMHWGFARLGFEQVLQTRR